MYKTIRFGSEYLRTIFIPSASDNGTNLDITNRYVSVRTQRATVPWVQIEKDATVPWVQIEKDNAFIYIQATGNVFLLFIPKFRKKKAGTRGF